ncbi:MAG: hypothetical protein JO326_05770 [Acetobacteraceae bacterium]|nr:hypothetical protein [Acetobacteraceae bacterium]
MSAALDLVRAAEAAGVRLEARLWCDAPDRLAPALRDALAAERPAVLRLLLDGGGGEPTGSAPAPAAEPSDPMPLVYKIDSASLADAAGHFPSLDGYKLAALRRPPSLPMTAPPGAGCYCTCCAGRAWWCERETPSGWRCRTCYAPDHLPAEAVRTVQT